MKNLVRQEFEQYLMRARKSFIRHYYKECPLARYLGIIVEDKTAGVQETKLPKWAIEFVRRVDSGSRGDNWFISPEQALGILGRIP